MQKRTISYLYKGRENKIDNHLTRLNDILTAKAKAPSFAYLRPSIGDFGLNRRLLFPLLILYFH